MVSWLKDFSGKSIQIRIDEAIVSLEIKKMTFLLTWKIFKIEIWTINV